MAISEGGGIFLFSLFAIPYSLFASLNKPVCSQGFPPMNPPESCENPVTGTINQ